MRGSMKYTDFNNTCESPTVVTLWAGALCTRRKLSFMPHYWLSSGGGASCFFCFFNLRFSFRLSWAFFCFSLLFLSFFPLSAIFVSPCLKMTCAGLWRRNPVVDGGHRTANGVNPMSTQPVVLLMQTQCQEKRKPPLTRGRQRRQKNGPVKGRTP